ncbi:MAG: hypothetical protein EAZ55_07000 [Cytophagales bacterium]|nr:MAG: hypothetical protein EAZ55_07000 [Cytophagales bacterium]
MNFARFSISERKKDKSFLKTKSIFGLTLPILLVVLVRYKVTLFPTNKKTLKNFIFQILCLYL